MKWSELDWPTVQDLDKQLPVVIPIGSIEQHGLHLPLCTDTTQVSSIAETAEAQLGDTAVFVPTLWLGSSHHHLDFPGTLSLRPSLYSRVLQEIAMSVLSAGFRRLFFLNGHGGNEVPAAQALSELAVTEPLAKEAALVMSSWWSVGKPNASELGLQSPSITHACEYETSLIMFLRPELVKENLIRDAAPLQGEKWLTGEKRVGIYRRFAAMTAHGNMGTPTAASREKGQRIFDAVVRDVVTFVQEFAEWPLPTQLGPKR
jgi:creatinine amidohydrolase